MPRIGLLSDSHGRAGTTRQAVERLLEAGAQVLIHLGDIGTVEVIDALLVPDTDGTDQMETHLVFGNTDWDHGALACYAADLGLHVDHPAGRIAFDGGELAFCHGHERLPMDRALAEGVRYLCHGHTHRVLDSREGRTRVLNPGALFRASVYTVGMLDTEADRFDVIELEDQGSR